MSVASEKDAAVFLAGLGDAIRALYRGDDYRQISEAATRRHVIVASTNPFASEIFRFHANSQILPFTICPESFLG